MDEDNVPEDRRAGKETANSKPVGVLERRQFNADFKLDWHDGKEAHDGYQLKWVGKSYARLEAGTAPDAVIIPDAAHNSAPENALSENLFFTGDNLQMLKHLRNAYQGAVQMIYIDPPYNTGSDGFVYQDKFEFSDEELQNMLGLSDAEVKRLHIINGRSSHSAWLSFMYPRLKIAKELLRDDGAIFISIDDNEQANLKLLCDEIFGEGNYIETFSWVKTSTPPSLSKKSRKTNEYILCYEKFRNNISYNAGEIEGGDQPLLNAGNPIRELYFPVGSVEFNNAFPDGEYCAREAEKIEIIDKFSVKNNRNSSPLTLKGAFKWTQNFLYEEIKKGTRFIIKSDKVAIRFIRNEVRQKRPNNYITASVITPLIDKKGAQVGTNESAAKEIIQLLERDCFNYPKPVSLIKYISKFIVGNYSITPPPPESAQPPVILDFFAGSGTTAQAVMELNAEDGGNRRYILCQLDEPVKPDSEAKRAGYDTIDQIARERIKRAAAKLKKNLSSGGKVQGETGNLGFRHYYIKPPRAQTIDKITEFDPDRPALIADDMVAEFTAPAALGGAAGEEVLLTTWLVADGYKITDTIEKLDIAGYQAHYAGGNRLYLIAAGWRAEQTKELLNRIGTYKLNVTVLTLSGYSFDFESLRELENNLRQSLNKAVQIIKRY